MRKINIDCEFNRRTKARSSEADYVKGITVSFFHHGLPTAWPRMLRSCLINAARLYKVIRTTVTHEGLWYHIKLPRAPLSYSLSAATDRHDDPLHHLCAFPISVSLVTLPSHIARCRSPVSQSPPRESHGPSVTAATFMVSWSSDTAWLGLVHGSVLHSW
jgi:hypothetical protein